MQPQTRSPLPVGTAAPPAHEGPLPGRLRPATALVAATVFALAAAWLLPRGAVTTGQAVLLLLAGLAVGLLLGRAIRSRWAWVTGPALFIGTYELRWLGVDGPMTDRPPLDSVIAVVPLAFGRAWLALLVLVPMLVGLVYGRVLRSRLGARIAGGPPPPRRLGRRILTGVATLAVVVLLVGLLRPATTPPIVDAQGDLIAGSIAELSTIEVGGHEQTLLLRGHDTTAPVLLHLEGGPGATGLGALRLFGEQLEEDFVVVTWDQRGTGKSYPALEPRDTHTLDRAVGDLLEVTDHLRARFDEDRIYLLGNSWGTTLAVLAAQRQPDRFHALIGTGQMVSQRETDHRLYEQQLREALAAGDTDRYRRLGELGPPPFADIAAYAPLLVVESDHPETEWPANILVPEYTLLEKINSAPALLETFATLYPQLQELDFRRDVPTLEVPIYLVEGSEEDPARSAVLGEWLAVLDAPRVERVVVEGVGHRPHLQDPDGFARIMRSVLDETAAPPGNATER
jgi:proline iminopeptidase